MNPERISKEEYALRLAETAAMRSEDPFYQVGAAALTGKARVIATAYNGLLPGVTMDEDWWNDKEGRKPYMIHAEQNLCTLFKAGEVDLVAVTLQPCPDCLRLLMAHGVKKVVYRQRHAGSIFSDELARFYKIELVHAPQELS